MIGLERDFLFLVFLCFCPGIGDTVGDRTSSRCTRLLKKAQVVILRSQGDEASLVIPLRFFASLRMADLLRGNFNSLARLEAVLGLFSFSSLYLSLDARAGFRLVLSEFMAGSLDPVSSLVPEHQPRRFSQLGFLLAG